MAERKVNPIQTVTRVGDNNNKLSITVNKEVGSIQVSTIPKASMVSFSEEASKNIYHAIIDLSFLTCDDIRIQKRDPDYFEKHRSSHDDSRIYGTGCGSEIHITYDKNANITAIPGEGNENVSIHMKNRDYKNAIKGILNLFSAARKDNRISKNTEKETTTP